MLEYTVPHNASLITTGMTNPQSINQSQLKLYMLLVVCDDYAINARKRRALQIKRVVFLIPFHSCSVLLQIYRDNLPLG